MSVWRWADWMDAPPAEHRITLGEGDTPLIPSRRIGPSAGLRNLWFKLETSNPSGSFKDRFAVGAVAHMLADGHDHCVATSSGNTGASLAAYCAAAGIRCEIAIVETAPPGKLQQMLAYGAELYRVRGFGLDSRVSAAVFEELARLGSQPRAALQISGFKYSPRGMAAVRSVAFELAEQSHEPIDHVFCMAGGGGLTLGVAQGFARLVAEGQLAASPKVECVQPAGNDTIAGPLRRGEERAQTIECTSRISGLQVPTVVDGDEVIPACRASGGTGHLVSDAAIWEVQSRLAREEGVFAEPAGATGLAGVLQAAAEGLVSPDAKVVCIVTGTGFKDPASLERMVADRECPTIDAEALRARSE